MEFDTEFGTFPPKNFEGFKMKRFLVISALASFSLIINLICYFTNSLFITDFLQDKAVDIMGIILPINTAGIGQIHITMNGIEERLGKIIFTKSRKDFKITLLVLILGFLSAFLLMFMKSYFIFEVDGTSQKVLINKKLVHFLNLIHLTIFFAYIYALYEICVDCIMKIPAFIKND